MSVEKKKCNYLSGFITRKTIADLNAVLIIDKNKTIVNICLLCNVIINEQRNQNGPKLISRRIYVLRTMIYICAAYASQVSPEKEEVSSLVIQKLNSRSTKPSSIIIHLSSTKCYKIFNHISVHLRFSH